MDTGIDLTFGDGKYRFALLLPQIFELERLCGGANNDGVRIGKSIFVIYEELSAGLGLAADEQPVFMGGGRAHALDIRETIRLGLIGGGMSPTDALLLVSNYCFPTRPVAECLGVAWAILRAVIEGIAVKKKEEPKQTAAKKSKKKKVITEGP